MKKDRTENIQKTYKKCAPYGNCTEIVQKIYKKCAKFCNSSLVETGSLFELLQILAHFLYIFCTISVQFPYGAHFLYIFCMFSYVFCMFSVRSFFIGVGKSFCGKGHYVPPQCVSIEDLQTLDRSFWSFLIRCCFLVIWFEE